MATMMPPTTDLQDDLVELAYALLDDHGWAQHFHCGWKDARPPDEGMCGKELAERESVSQLVDLIREHIGGVA